MTEYTFTAAELDEAVAEMDGHWYEFPSTWGENTGQVYNENGAPRLEFGTFIEIADWNNGDGNEMGKVIQHVETGRYFRKTGWYSSWDSGRYDGDLEEVFPVTETVKRFKGKNAVYAYEDPTETVKG